MDIAPSSVLPTDAILSVNRVGLRPNFSIGEKVGDFANASAVVRNGHESRENGPPPHPPTDAIARSLPKSRSIQWRKGFWPPPGLQGEESHDHRAQKKPRRGRIPAFGANRMDRSIEKGNAKSITETAQSDWRGRAGRPIRVSSDKFTDESMSSNIKKSPRGLAHNETSSPPEADGPKTSDKQKAASL